MLNRAKHKNKENIGVEENDDETELRNKWKFDPDAIRKALSEMIIMDELPFLFVKNEGFRKFMKIVCPQFVVPSRTTITRDCMDLYRTEKEKFESLFSPNDLFHHRHVICFTTDMWTSNQRLSYLCLTAHFIDDDWKLCKRVLNFMPCSSHKEDDVGVLLEKCLSKWGIKRVFTITVDNAYSNDKTVKYLKGRLGSKGMAPLGGNFLHIRCVAHILNLVVKDGLEEIAVSVDRVRVVVKYVRQSPQRLEKFRGYAKEEEIKCSKILSLDVPTRWNTIFYMLETTLIFQGAFERYYFIDPEFGAAFPLGGDDDICDFPTSNDWEEVKNLVVVLHQFERITKKVLGNNYVTSSLFLDEVSDLHGIIKDIIDGSNKELSEVAKSIKTKFDKYWGKPEKINMILFIPVILDPRKKLEFLQDTLKDIYGDDLGMKMTYMANDLLSQLFKEYKQVLTPPTPPIPIANPIVREGG